MAIIGAAAGRFQRALQPGLQRGQRRQGRGGAAVEAAVHRQSRRQHMALALGGDRQGIHIRAAFLGPGGLETAARLHQLPHRRDQVLHVALQEQAAAGGEGRGDGQQQGRLQHPPLVVPQLEPGVRELQGHQFQPGGLQQRQPVRQVDVGVAVEEAQVGQTLPAAVGLGGLHQGTADLQAQVVAAGPQGGHGQQEPPPGGTDVEVQGQAGILEKFAGERQGARQLVEPAEGIDVLTHHQGAWEPPAGSFGTRNPQLAV